MLEMRDIGGLFSVFKAAYGHQWSQDADAAEVWLRKLGGYSRDEMTKAARLAVEKHRDYPPTLGQFEILITGVPMAPRPNTYLPAPQMSKARIVANNTMKHVLLKSGGVPPITLKNMVGLKNALADEWVEPITHENVTDLIGQLQALVDCA